MKQQARLIEQDRIEASKMFNNYFDMKIAQQKEMSSQNQSETNHVLKNLPSEKPSSESTKINRIIQRGGQNNAENQEVANEVAKLSPHSNAIIHMEINNQEYVLHKVKKRESALSETPQGPN